MSENITVLGATGSIGQSTLDVISRHPDRYRVFAITAQTQVAKLFEICRQHDPEYAVVAQESDAEHLQAQVRESGLRTSVIYGEKGLEFVSSAEAVDTVVAAIVGGAGLMPTMAAVETGKKVLLANKESLVMAGHLFMSAVERSGSRLLPIDSEHNAIFQCLPTQFSSLEAAGVTKLLLTGSGGPFRDIPIEQLEGITPAQAIAHPNWSMGPKISVDSATMMNKGLELIEACWLFNAKPSEIDVVIHPQSIVHSMVQYADGSVLCQMGLPDMRTPIANCLAWPERINAGVATLNWTHVGQLTFESPDFERFPCLKLAIDAVKTGGSMPIAINAANEVAVAKFLDGKMGFRDIAKTVSSVAEEWRGGEPSHLDDVISADREARALAKQVIAAL